MQIQPQRPIRERAIALSPKALAQWFFSNRFFAYVFSGGTGALINMAGLYLLTDVFGLWYVASGVISFMASVAVTFILQKTLTFKDATHDSTGRKFLIFAVIAICNLIMNTVLLFLFTEKAHIYYLVSQLLSGSIIAIWTYFIYKRFVFKAVAAEILD